MANIIKGLEQGQEQETLLSSFERYQEMKPIHEAILKKVKNGRNS